MKVKYVRMEDVVELLELIKERDIYHDWSIPHAELQKKVDLKFAILKQNAKEVEEQ